jgi:hypothetical protein
MDLDFASPRVRLGLNNHRSFDCLKRVIFVICSYFVEINGYGVYEVLGRRSRSSFLFGDLM